jgi:gas vesicle protein
MAVIKSLAKFVVGSATGAATGAATAMLLAPESGRDLQRHLRERIHSAKVAGVEAKATKENELIRKYRLIVCNEGALKETEAHSASVRAESIAAITANR